MADTQEKTQAQVQHESNKVLRERLAHAHWIMSYQTKYIPEQFAEVQKTLDFIKEVCAQLQAKIEEVEPPVKKEEKAVARGPYFVDVPMSTNPEAQA